MTEFSNSSASERVSTSSPKVEPSLPQFSENSSIQAAEQLAFKNSHHVHPLTEIDPRFIHLPSYLPMKGFSPFHTLLERIGNFAPKIAHSLAQLYRDTIGVSTPSVERKNRIQTASQSSLIAAREQREAALKTSLKEEFYRITKAKNAKSIKPPFSA